MGDNYGFKDWGSEPLPIDTTDYEAEAKAERDRELRRKEAERTGELLYEADGTLIHDSNAMIRAKEVVNAASRGADWLLEASTNIADFGQGKWLDNAQFDAENNGKRYSMSNKDFISARNTSTKDLIKQYKDAVNDPNAGGTVYTLKKFDGYNEDGTEKFLYKYGFAKVGADQRYNFGGTPQDIQDGYEIVEEKRFTGAEDWEKTWNANQDVLNARAIDYGGTPEGVSRDKASGVNFGDGYTELLTKDLLGNDVGKTQEDYDRNREYSKRLTAAANARYKAGLSDSVVDAFQSGAASLIVDTADFVLDVFTPGDNTMLNDIKKKENIDKWVGYDRTKSTQVLTDAATNWKNGNYFDAITGVLTDPNTMAESLPMMIGMSVGTGKFTAASKLLSAVERAKKTGTSVEHIAKLENRARKLMTAKEIGRYEKYQNSSALLKTLDHFSRKSGYYTTVGTMTNNVLDDRIAAKLKAGEDPKVDMFEVASVYATQLILLSIDKMSFSKATGIGEGAGALKKAFKSLTKAEQKPIISKLVNKATSIAEAGATEGVQEYIQTWGEILGANLGVGNKTMSDVLGNEANQKEALMGGLGGIGAGAQTRAVTDIPSTVKDVNQAIADKTYTTLSNNDLEFSSHNNDLQIADLKALNDEAMDRIKTLNKEVKLAPDPTKTEEIQKLIASRKTNLESIRQMELTQEKTKVKSKVNSDEEVDLGTDKVKGIADTTNVPILKDISQGMNNKKVLKEFEKYSTEKLRNAVTKLKSKEPSETTTKTLAMLNKVITSREKGESKVFTKNSVVNDISKLDSLTGKDKITKLSSILSNNTKLPDQETFDKLKSIINDVDNVQLTDKARTMYNKRLDTIKSLGFGVDDVVEPELKEEPTESEIKDPTQYSDDEVINPTVKIVKDIIKSSAGREKTDQERQIISNSMIKGKDQTESVHDIANSELRDEIKESEVVVDTHLNEGAITSLNKKLKELEAKPKSDSLDSEIKKVKDQISAEESNTIKYSSNNLNNPSVELVKAILRRKAEGNTLTQNQEFVLASASKSGNLKKAKDQLLKSNSKAAKAYVKGLQGIVRHSEASSDEDVSTIIRDTLLDTLSSTNEDLTKKSTEELVILLGEGC